MRAAGAHRIRARGWAQGDDAVDLDGPVDSGPCCILTAVIGDGLVESRLRAARVIGLDESGRNFPEWILIDWNDAPGRTADEVIAVLERVAAGEGATDYLATTTT